MHEKRLFISDVQSNRNQVCGQAFSENKLWVSSKKFAHSEELNLFI